MLKADYITFDYQTSALLCNNFHCNIKGHAQAYVLVNKFNNYLWAYIISFSINKRNCFFWVILNIFMYFVIFHICFNQTLSGFFFENFTPDWKSLILFAKEVFCSKFLNTPNFSLRRKICFKKLVDYIDTREVESNIYLILVWFRVVI